MAKAVLRPANAAPPNRIIHAIPVGSNGSSRLRADIAVLSIAVRHSSAVNPSALPPNPKPS